jgi:hypothetical protein
MQMSYERSGEVTTLQSVKSGWPVQSVTGPQSCGQDAGVSPQSHVPLPQSDEPPVHVPPLHASPTVHAFPSSHAVLVRHCQVPPVFVQ